MPKVGNKRFAYTKQGEQQAQNYAKKTGKKLVNTQKTKKKA